MKLFTHTNTTQISTRLTKRLVLAGSLGFVCATTPLVSATGTTTVTQQVLPGTLALVTQSAATLSAVTLSGTASQSATGSLGLNTVTDARGTGAGWSLTATTSAFTSVGTPLLVSGTAGSLVTLGNYTGSTAGTYTVNIAAGGTLGTATYTVSGLEAQTATTTGVAVPLGTRGLNLTFAGATYTVGEQWTISINVIPANDLTLTPSVVVAVSGLSSNVTAGSAYTYITGSDPATIMSAAAGSGLGVYTNTPALTLAIPAGTKAGTYVGTITETAS